MKRREKRGRGEQENSWEIGEKTRSGGGASKSALTDGGGGVEEQSQEVRGEGEEAEARSLRVNELGFGSGGSRRPEGVLYDLPR